MKSVSFALLLALLCSVQATHFRFGTLTYTVPNPSQPNTVQLTLTCIFRASYFTAATNNGINTLTVGGQIQMNVDNNEFTFGDGSAQATLPGVVLAIDNVQDAVTCAVTLTHTYATTVATIYNVVFNSRARISTLNNNHDYRYEVSSNVSISFSNPQNSPVSSSLPIVPATQNTTNVINLEATSPGGYALTFSLSSSGLQGNLSYATQPPNFVIDPSTGDVTWNTRGVALGLWNAQVMITDAVGNYIVLDFLLNVVPPTLHAVPYFSPFTPVDSSVLEYPPGVAISFVIGALSNVSSDNITISSGSLPAGVVFNPPVGRNPANRTVSWTNPQPGTYIFPFTATNGYASVSTTFEVIIDPYPTDPPTGPPTDAPTGVPTGAPSDTPTGAPTGTPTGAPSGAPTDTPSAAPSGPPTGAPTTGPFCGDGICQAAEYCSNCIPDCGTCPMVIYNRYNNYVAYATSFVNQATITLVPYNNQTAPTLAQSWYYNTTSNRITSRKAPNLIIGAGPTAQKQASSVHALTWDFKANFGDTTYFSSEIHEFLMIPVPGSSLWNFFEDKQLTTNANIMDPTNANFDKCSCLEGPYGKPTNASLLEVWGPRCNSTSLYQQWRFWTYQFCKNCP